MKHKDFLKLKEGDLIYSKYDPTLSGFITKIKKYKEICGMFITKSTTQYIKGPRTITEITIKQRNGTERYISDDRDLYKHIEREEKNADFSH